MNEHFAFISICIIIDTCFIHSKVNGAGIASALPRKDASTQNLIHIIRTHMQATVSHKIKQEMFIKHYAPTPAPLVTLNVDHMALKSTGH